VTNIAMGTEIDKINEFEDIKPVPESLVAQGGKACGTAQGGRAEGRHRLHHGARHARRRAVLFGDERRGRGPEQGQDRRRHELDLADRDQGLRQAINALGCDYLDAPVSGGEVGAKAATLTIMVGGPRRRSSASSRCSS
jgi:2-hydroxy-3-oxopropionate reductase